jgi:hypothetical protein
VKTHKKVPKKSFVEQKNILKLKVSKFGGNFKKKFFKSSRKIQKKYLNR